jgi:hypothetical protein
MNADDFRKIALALPEAIESEHMRHPDFRVGGRIFATLGAPDAGYGMAKLDPESQERYLRLYPKVFSQAAGAWGRRGCTLILLKAAKPAIIDIVLAIAWRLAAPKALAAQHPPNAGQ